MRVLIGILVIGAMGLLLQGAVNALSHGDIWRQVYGRRPWGRQDTIQTLIVGGMIAYIVAYLLLR